MVKKTLYIIFISLLFTSCIFNPGYWSNNLILEKVDYDGNQIEIGGYYYKTYINSEQKLYADVYFLYNNGVIINVGGYIIGEGESSFNKNINNGYSISIAKKYRDNYGVFQINNTNLKIEKWYGPYSYVKDGKILNDTTFVLYNNSKEGEVDTIGDIYHFKQFSPKPDSTNKFIK